MTSPQDHPSQARENVKECLFALGRLISAQLTTYTISPIVGSAISVILTSIFALNKLRKAIRLSKKQNFLDYVEKEIIIIEDEIRRLEEKISMLKEIYQGIKEEHRKISLEEQLRVLLNQLKELVKIKLYFESIKRSLQVIEPLRHLYGDKIDEIYFKVMDLANKASEGKIKEKEIKELIDKVDYYMDNIPDFPQILLETTEENLR